MNIFKKTHVLCCPYCQGELAEKPKRKKKCPHCRNYIYIRNGEMKTEEEAKVIDFVKRFEWLDISLAKVKKEQNILSKKFGKKASANDTIWAILNKSLGKASSRDKVSIYIELAYILKKEGKDNTKIMKEATKWKRESIIADVKEIRQVFGNKRKISIQTCNDNLVCENCRKNASREWTIKEFLNEIPIPDDCTNEGGCRCWISVI